MYTVIDLFAGAGGLSLGFMQTKKYDIKVAFENSPYMQETYKKNHPGVDVQGDVCSADYAEIQRKHGEIDVVIGGPPCQGFSNANRQKNHAISQNNMLVKQYIRAITELHPKAFVMENVSMLKSDTHRFYMEKTDEELIKRCNISVKNTPLHLLDSKYVFAGALKIVKSKERIEKYLWPEAKYFELNVIYKASKNQKKLKKALEKHRGRLEKMAAEHEKIDNTHIEIKSAEAFRAVSAYYEKRINSKVLIARIEPAIMLQRMLSKAQEIFDNNILVDSYSQKNGIIANIRSFAVFDYLKGVLTAPENEYVITHGVLCAANYGAPQKRMRFVVMGIRRDISSTVTFPKPQFTEKQYRTVKDAIKDLENVKPVFNVGKDIARIKIKKSGLGELAKELRDSDILRNHIITKTTKTAMKRFESLQQGQNFHSLDSTMVTNTYTDPSRTQNTIYLRLSYNEPSGTVVNVRKSMWIHPTKNRAISIREAARLQTFPDSFVFCGTKDSQYQQVGNAVPPILAKAIAESIASILVKSGGRDNEKK